MFRFLIVDDSRVMRRMLQNTLKASGYEDSEFIEAVDGRDALDKLEEFAYDVDVVFCDLCMPNLDGSGFVESLSKSGHIQSIAIIICTGDIREGRGQDTLAQGARALICKPFTKENVVEALAKVFQEH